MIGWCPDILNNELSPSNELRKDRRAKEEEESNDCDEHIYYDDEEEDDSEGNVDNWKFDNRFESRTLRQISLSSCWFLPFSS